MFGTLLYSLPYVSHLNSGLHFSSANSHAPSVTPTGQIFLDDVYYRMYKKFLPYCLYNSHEIQQVGAMEFIMQIMLIVL
jgi:hypothetical protein